MTAFANHLWQSTIFAAAALLLTVTLRHNRAQVRYVVWLAASIKFLVPFSLLFALGAGIHWPAPAPRPPVIDTIGNLLAPPFAEIAARRIPAPFWPGPNWLPGIWLSGVTFILVRWYVHWRRLQHAARHATRLGVEAPIPVLSSAAPIEPGVFGILRPVLLAPSGILDQCSTDQWEAIIAHELCHVRRRDNLFAAMHTIVEAVFWFHPAVWWIGSRLIREREHACDEQVLGSGHDPETYVTGILKVCRLYVQSPFDCATGVAGADLKERIEAIMTRRIQRKLTTAAKALLGVVAAAAVAGPIWFGIVDLPGLRAQTAVSPDLKFEVASIRAVGQSVGRAGFDVLPGGAVRAKNITARMLIAYAYNLEDSMLAGGPRWIESDAFDIAAKPDRAEDPPGAEKMTDDERLRARLRALLIDRFHLETRVETKQQPVYVLTIAKGGSKLAAAKHDGPPGLMRGPGTLTSRSSEMYHLCTLLSHWFGVPVVDRTGIKGTFDYLVRFEDNSDDVAGPGGPPPDSFFAALEDQLGLKLQRTRTPVELVVIERIEKPSAN